MKKLILITFLFTAVSVIAQSYTTDKIWRNPLETEWNQIEQISEDTCVKYVGRMESAKWICTDTIYYLCDTVKGSGTAGGSQADSTHFKLYMRLYNDLNKALKETKDLDEYKAIQAQLTLLVYLIKEEELIMK